ncbi:MAG TPA: type II toxin-antitoxin system PemK/MazF family toxin [Candidatus Paceibacterota bacterium]
MKEFKMWSRVKMSINEYNHIRRVHERDIWWCSMGVNVGDELDGKGQEFGRPVLVMKQLSARMVLIVPLTSSQSEHKYRLDVGYVKRERSKIILSQIRVVDTRRFMERITILDKKTFGAIQKAARELLF